MKTKGTVKKTPHFRIHKKGQKDLNLFRFYIYSEEFCNSEPAPSHISATLKYGILIHSSLSQARPEIRHFTSQRGQRLVRA